MCGVSVLVLGCGGGEERCGERYSVVLLKVRIFFFRKAGGCYAALMRP